MKSLFEKNYYLEQPVKFRLRSKKADFLMRGTGELLKLMLINSKLMKIVPNERLFERPFVLSSLPKKKNLKILDLGCGDSIFPLELASLDHEVWGSDPKDFTFKEKIKFVKGDFIKRKEAFPKNYFDVVVCVSAIEHFGLEIALGEKIKEFGQNRKDIEAIAQARQILKKGGLLILTTPFSEKKKLAKHERVYDIKEISNLTQGYAIVEKRIIDANNKLINDQTPHNSIFMGVFKKK